MKKTKMLNLRPHHIISFLRFNLSGGYKLSDNEFVESFNSRNIKMAHNKEFVIYWKRFLEQLRVNPDQKIICSRKEDIICKNCDIRNKCIKKNSELHDIALNQDIKAEKELNITEGDVFEASKLINV